MSDITPVSAWKKKPEPITLPSGNRILVKRSSLRAFLVKGVIPNSLMSIVEESISSGSNKATDEEMKKILGDPTKLGELMELMDGITVDCALEPQVHRAPENEADRRDDLLYVDELDEQDKIAIFNFATGTPGELEPFREEPPAGVGPVQGG